MVKEKKVKKPAQRRKGAKNVDIVSQAATIIWGMEKEQIMKVSALADSISLENDSHPHFDTVEKKCAEARLWLDVPVRFLEKNGKIVGIQRVPHITEQTPLDVLIRDEFMGKLEKLMKHFDLFAEEMKEGIGILGKKSDMMDKRQRNMEHHLTKILRQQKK